MISKSKTIQNSHNSLFVFRVILHQSFKNFNLNFSLFMQFCLVSYNFKSNNFFCQMVKTLYDLSKWPVTQSFNNFIPEENVFFGEYMDVVSVRIVVPIVLNTFFTLLRFWIAKVVDCVKEFEFYSFLFWKKLLVVFKKLVFAHRIFGSFSLGHGYWIEICWYFTEFSLIFQALLLSVTLSVFRKFW